MYAPMAFRFNTYGVQLSGAAQEYRHFLLANPLLQNWLESARAETEVIESVEVGNR
jgi:glutathione S-transferase